MTAFLAVAFAAVQWPVYLLQKPALPTVSISAALADNVALDVAFAGLIAAIVVLAALYRQALRTGRRAEAARESAAAALRSHRVWLAEAEEKFAAASNARQFQSMFLAHVSNELRVPLNAMLGFSEIIKDELFGPVGTPRYKGYAQSIHQSAGQLLRSVNNLLDLSRVTANRLELRDRVVDLPVALAQITNGFAAALEPKNLTLTLDVGEDLPRLRADLRLLRGMVQSLVSNAVKFTEKRDIITVRARLDEVGRMVIAVADNGIGIAPKDLALVMQPFGQAEPANRSRQGGIGLGLPFTKSMIELHGGSFELRSVLHEGTTVTLKFPAERTVVGSDAAENPASEEAPAPTPDSDPEVVQDAAAENPAEPRRNIG